MQEPDQLLTDDVVLIVKLHQVVVRKIPLEGEYQYIRSFHPFYEKYHFLNIADGLITDYPSAFFDGLYFEINELPFQRVDTVQKSADYMNQKSTFLPDKNIRNFWINTVAVMLLISLYLQMMY